MAEATGEEGLLTRKELDKLQMEGFRDARFEMGGFWWKEVEGWVLGVGERVDEMGTEVRGKRMKDWISQVIKFYTHGYQFFYFEAKMHTGSHKPVQELKSSGRICMVIAYKRE